MDILVLVLFCITLLVCVGFNISILYALGSGLIFFLLYGVRKGFCWRELIEMVVSGIKTVKNILITFVLIGILTALWREAGTISVMVCYASSIIRPSLFLFMAFLLNCMVSVLTGTSFGTAATMGVICATMASAMQVEPMLVGGAVLSGAFFGDRCSPVSTSALLVSELTHTSIFDNMKGMLRTAAIPFAITCVVYTVIGFLSKQEGELPNLYSIFERQFVLHWVALLPAVVILVLSFFRMSVKKAMVASILTALPICIWLQNTPWSELVSLVWRGYQTTDLEIASMLNGGGIVSMVKVGMIVCLSSSYSGIFQKTGLLNRVKREICHWKERTNPYTAVLCTSIATSVIACNQSLTIMLTHQLCDEIGVEDEQIALYLEDSAVVVAPLVPWSIAGAVPLATIGAPSRSMLFACFLYLLPIWCLILENVPMRRKRVGKK